jgi:hypothetical protein
MTIFSHGLRSGTPLAASLLASAVLASGCGGSGKPAYCTSYNNLKKSIDTLTHTSITDTSALEKNFNAVKTDAESLAKNLKSSLGSQATTVTNSADAMVHAVQQAIASPNATTIAAVPTAVSSFADTIKGLEGVSGKCK